MPLAILHMSPGALGEAALQNVVSHITDAFLEVQGAPLSSVSARAITRVEVQEYAKNRVFVGGKPNIGDPLYRVDFFTPEGALDADKRKKLVKITTDAILIGEGTDITSEEDRHRIWCIVSTVPDGSWSCAGEVYNWRAIKRWVAMKDIRLRRFQFKARSLVSSVATIKREWSAEGRP